MCVLSGCEFFKEYKDRDYTAEGLVFNWNQVDPDLDSLASLVWASSHLCPLVGLCRRPFDDPCVFYTEPPHRLDPLPGYLTHNPYAQMIPESHF